MKFWEDRLSRREAILRLTALASAGSALSGCRGEFMRPHARLDMGKVEQLLYERQHIRERALVAYRFSDGWSVMSSRCTYDGCELTYHDNGLLCSCCRSVFYFEGQVLKAPAKHSLPFYRMETTNNRIYALAGDEVKRDYRFTTPELEKKVKGLRARGLDQVGSRIKVPEVLKGEGTGEVGRMFVEEPPVSLADLGVVKEFGEDF